MTQETYPALWHLFGVYFHQDWDLAGPDWEAVIAEYNAEVEPEDARRAADEITVLLRDTPDDGELRRIVLDDFDCGYLPEPGGFTMRAWLMEMRRALLPDAG